VQLLEKLRKVGNGKEKEGGRNVKGWIEVKRVKYIDTVP
jgi:hypothetical protein